MTTLEKEFAQTVAEHKSTIYSIAATRESSTK